MSERPKLVVVKGGAKTSESRLPASMRRGKRLYDFIMSINNISDAAFADFIQWAEDWKRLRAVVCPCCGKCIMAAEKYADNGVCSFGCYNKLKQGKIQ